jgi:hypothetical protein
MTVYVSIYSAMVIIYIYIYLYSTFNIKNQQSYHIVYIACNKRDCLLKQPKGIDLSNGDPVYILLSHTL